MDGAMDAVFHCGLRLPIPSDLGVTIGRNKPTNCLLSPYISNNQFKLVALPGSEPRCRLTAEKQGAVLIVEAQEPGAEGDAGWREVFVLEHGQSCDVGPRSRVYLSGLKQEPLMVTLVAAAPGSPGAPQAGAAVAAAAAAAGPGSSGAPRKAASAGAGASGGGSQAAGSAEDADSDDVVIVGEGRAGEGATSSQRQRSSPAKRPRRGEQAGEGSSSQGAGASGGGNVPPPAMGAAATGAAATIVVAGPGPGSTSATAAPGSGAPGAPASRLPDAADTPVTLMRVRQLSDPSFNTGCLGASLRDLVEGPMTLALISNYMVDVHWMLSAYPWLVEAQQLVLVHGEGEEAQEGMKAVFAAVGVSGSERLTLHRPPLPITYGTHHSKAFILQYAGGLRVIVHTANMIYGDCNDKSQAIWAQDFPRKLPHAGESTFERELQRYVAALRLPPRAHAAVRDAIAAHDFSGARGHLVASVPGYHHGPALCQWGHMALRSLLSQVALPPDFEAPSPSPPKGKGKAAQEQGSAAAGAAADASASAQPPPGSALVVQCSSLGSLDEKWLLQEFGMSLARHSGTQPGPFAAMTSQLWPTGPSGKLPLRIVWPSVEEVRASLEGWQAGGSIPGSKANVEKPFLQPYWCRWGGEPAGRGRAMPHIKTYTRHRGNRLAWFLVTSSNLSKAAWGTLQKNGAQLMVRSYELGVLVTPQAEAAYRASPRHYGFCAHPPSAPAAAAAGGSAAAPAAAPPQPGSVELWALAQLLQERGAGRRVGGGSGGSGAPPNPAAAAAAAALARLERQQQQQQAADAAGPSSSASEPAASEQPSSTPGPLRVFVPVPYTLPPQRYVPPADRPWMTGEYFEGLDSRGRQLGHPYSMYGHEQDDW